MDLKKADKSIKYDYNIYYYYNIYYNHILVYLLESQLIALNTRTNKLTNSQSGSYDLISSSRAKSDYQRSDYLVTG